MKTFAVPSLILILNIITGMITGCSSPQITSYSPPQNSTSLLTTSTTEVATERPVVITPVKFDVSSITVSPDSIIAGQSATVNASIKNNGLVKDTQQVILRINDSRVNSQALTLEAGSSAHVSFNITPSSTGIIGVNINGLSCTLKVFSLSQSFHENGLCYGSFRDGQSPEYQVFPSTEQIREDLQFIKQITNNIRTYGTVGTLVFIPEIAKQLGMTVTLGISLSDDSVENEAEISRAIDLAKRGLIDSIIVGNECLTLSRLPKDKLIAYIRQVKANLPQNIPTSTAEFWNIWRDNPDLVKEVDFIMAHFYPYWENYGINGAAYKAIQEYQELEAIIKEEFPERAIEIVIGETGWPYVETWPTHKVPKPENWDGSSQRIFFKEFIKLACNHHIKYYYFEAFDEEWKWQEGFSGTGGVIELPQDREFSGKYIGSSWGIFKSNGELKSDFIDLFSQPEQGSRLERDIFVNGQLATYYDIGVDDSSRLRNWLHTNGDSLQMDYPTNQSWGVVFISVGTAVDENRPWKDFTSYNSLSFELKGKNGGESLKIGIKDHNDPDDGGEKTLLIQNIGDEWQSYNIPVTEFASPRFTITESLSRLYIIIEFVFK